MCGVLTNCNGLLSQYIREGGAQAKKSYEDKFGAKVCYYSPNRHALFICDMLVHTAPYDTQGAKTAKASKDWDEETAEPLPGSDAADAKATADAKESVRPSAGAKVSQWASLL